MNSITTLAIAMILIAGAVMLPLSINSSNADDSRKGGVCVIKAEGGECNLDFKNIKNLDLAIPIKVIVEGSVSQANVTQIVRDAVSQAITPLTHDISDVKNDLADVKRDITGLQNSTAADKTAFNQRLDGFTAQLKNITDHAITNVTITNGTGVITPPTNDTGTGGGSGTNDTGTGGSTGNGTVVINGTGTGGNETVIVNESGGFIPQLLAGLHALVNPS